MDKVGQHILNLERKIGGMRDTIEALQAANEGLRQALEYYADEDHWYTDSIDGTDLSEVETMRGFAAHKVQRGGRRAREALAKYGKKEG